MEITVVRPQTDGAIAWPQRDTTKRSVLTVGNFDGVHRGHAAVLQRTVELAKQYDAYAFAIIFNPRPSVYHAALQRHNGIIPDNEQFLDPAAIMSLDQRLEALEQHGIDHTFVIEYNQDFANKNYRFFLGQCVSKLGMRTLVLGADARMGKGREGDIEAIDTLAQATRMFELEVVDDRGPGTTRVPLVANDVLSLTAKRSEEELARLEQFTRLNDPTITKAQRRALTKTMPNRPVRIWSSTFARFLLLLGHVEQAQEILGHRHYVDGVIVRGEERGRKLGFPTANFSSEVEGYMPGDGVYAGWLIDTDNDGNEIRYPAALSIGTKETFEKEYSCQERLLEAYVIRESTEEWLDLYDHHLRAEFHSLVRRQQRFDSVEDLIRQLGADADECARRLCLQ